MAGHITVSENTALLEALELDADVLEVEALLDDEIPLYEEDGLADRQGQGAVRLSDLACVREVRAADRHTGVQFRECMIDYTACPNQHCVKKLV